MVLARPGDVLYELAPVTAVNLGSAFAEELTYAMAKRGS
jgi:hypothetical protein